MKFKVFSVTLLLVLLVGVLGAATAVQAAESEQQSQFTAPIMVVNTSFLNIRTGPGAQYTVLITVVGGTELPVLGVYKDQVWYQVSTVAGVGWINSEFAIPRGDFRNVPFVEAPTVVSTDLVIEGSAAGTEAVEGVSFSGENAWGVSVIVSHPARTRPTISATSPGTAVEDMSKILTLVESTAAEGIVWYRLDDPSLGLIWVEASKSVVRPFACELSAVRMISAVAPRLGPDGSGSLDGNLTVEVGAEAYLLDFVAGQYKIALFDGNTGWIPQGAAEVREPGAIPSAFCESGGELSRAGAASAGTASINRAVARVVINTGFLNVRSGPGAQYSVVTTVPGGTELAVVGFAPDGVWYLVEGMFGRGWVNSEFTLFRGDGRNIPVVRDITVAGAELSRPVAAITNAVTMYAAPNATLGTVGAVSGPLDAPIVARNADGTWVQISTPVGFGWVRASEVAISGDLDLAPIVGG